MNSNDDERTNVSQSDAQHTDWQHSTFLSEEELLTLIRSRRKPLPQLLRQACARTLSTSMAATAASLWLTISLYRRGDASVAAVAALLAAGCLITAAAKAYEYCLHTAIKHAPLCRMSTYTRWLGRYYDLCNLCTPRQQALVGHSRSAVPASSPRLATAMACIALLAGTASWLLVGLHPYSDNGTLIASADVRPTATHYHPGTDAPAPMDHPSQSQHRMAAHHAPKATAPQPSAPETATLSTEPPTIDVGPAEVPVYQSIHIDDVQAYVRCNKQCEAEALAELFYDRFQNNQV